MSIMERWLGSNALRSVALALVVAGFMLLGVNVAPAFAFEIRVVATSAFAAIACMLPKGTDPDDPRATRVQVVYRLAVLVVYELVLVGLAAFARSVPYGFSVVFLCIAAVLLAVRFVPTRENARRCYFALRVNETIVVLLGAYCMLLPNRSLRPDTTTTVLFGIYSLMVVGLLGIRAWEAKTGEPHPDSRSHLLAVSSSVAFSATAMAYLTGCTPFAHEPYVWSVLCMSTALACLAFGFYADMKSLRIYGLTLTMFCVVKLVASDTAELGVMARVASFMLAGALCFAGSLLYTHFAKMLPVEKPRAQAPRAYADRALETPNVPMPTSAPPTPPVAVRTRQAADPIPAAPAFDGCPVPRP